MASKDMDKLVSHAKTSGFVYQGSEIYGWLSKHMGLWSFRC